MFLSRKAGESSLLYTLLQWSFSIFTHYSRYFFMKHLLLAKLWSTVASWKRTWWVTSQCRVCGSWLMVTGLPSWSPQLQSTILFSSVRPIIHSFMRITSHISHVRGIKILRWIFFILYSVILNSLLWISITYDHLPYMNQIPFIRPSCSAVYTIYLITNKISTILYWWKPPKQWVK